MADFPGGRQDFLADQLQTGVGRRELAGYGVPDTQYAAATPAEAQDFDGQPMGEFARNAARATRTPRDFPALALPTGPETDWFGHVYVIPSSINAGIVLSLKVFTLTLYNAFKTASRSLDTFTNGVGAGLTIDNLPGLPATLNPQSGFTIDVNVSPEGPPTISGDLDFGFDTLTISVPVTGTRSIIFPHEPLTPLTERLQFLTDIRRRRKGTEQRAALRHTPRSVYDMRFQVEGRERISLEATLIDSQARPFGVPAWHESSILTAPIAVNDTIITVDSTAYSSLRADSLAMAFVDFDDFEALEIDSLTSTTVTFKTPFTKAFDAGVRLLPVRIARLISGPIRMRKFPVPSLQDVRLLFTTTDNDQDLSDTSAFLTFNSKVLLDGPNLIRGQLDETFDRRITVVDNGTGVFGQFTEVDISRPGRGQAFYTRTRQALWETRQLLYALRGRAVSFYLPTNYPDLIPTQTVASAADTITVENLGYTDFIQSRQPRNVIRLTKTDGTSVIRTVLSSAELSATEEQLTVDSPWGITAAVADIDRVDFVEKVRWDSDEFQIVHRDGLGQAQIRAPVKTVLE